MIISAIRNKLLALLPDPSRLATYDFGDIARLPSIHTGYRHPDDGMVPAIFIEESGGVGYSETTTCGVGGPATIKATQTITVLGSRVRYSELELRAVAWDVWRVLAGANISEEVEAIDPGRWAVSAIDITAPAHARDRDGFPSIELKSKLTVGRI